MANTNILINMADYFTKEEIKGTANDLAAAEAQGNSNIRQQIVNKIYDTILPHIEDCDVPADFSLRQPFDTSELLMGQSEQIALYKYIRDSEENARKLAAARVSDVCDRLGYDVDAINLLSFIEAIQMGSADTQLLQSAFAILNNTFTQQTDRLFYNLDGHFRIYPNETERQDIIGTHGSISEWILLPVVIQDI